MIVFIVLVLTAIHGSLSQTVLGFHPALRTPASTRLLVPSVRQDIYDPDWYDEFLEHKNSTERPNPQGPSGGHHPQGPSGGNRPQAPSHGDEDYPQGPSEEFPQGEHPHRPSGGEELPNWEYDECPSDVIHDVYKGHGYFFSWEDNRSSRLRMTWTQAVNFCRARCLEAVSIETIPEHEYLARRIARGRVRGVWTSGRKCDFSGCERESHLQPVDIYGWFWEGTRVQLPPTTDRFDTAWSNTGAAKRPQPDNLSGQRGGENESCLEILNNAYNDGVTWHDEVCSKRRPFICEDNGNDKRKVKVDPTKRPAVDIRIKPDAI